MNKDRRNRLYVINSKLQECVSELADILYDEQEAYDNLPEGLQASERGLHSETAISEMEQALVNIEESISSIDTAIGD